MAVVKQQPDESPPSRVRVFLKDKKKAVDGMENVGPGKRVTLTVEGTVSSYSSGEWFEGGADFEVRPESIRVETEEQTVSLDDAIHSAEKTV